MLKRIVVVSAALALAVVAAGAVRPAIAPKGVQARNKVTLTSEVELVNSMTEGVNVTSEPTPASTPAPDYVDLPIKRGRFLYLTQGPSAPPEWLCDVGSRSDSDVIWASFKEEVTTTCEGIANTIYVPHSSWTSGRNELYAKAIALQQNQGWRAEYFVFTDDDVPINTAPENGDPYDLFHAALGNVQPAVAAVSFLKKGKKKVDKHGKKYTKYARNVCGPIAPCAPDIDAAVNAFHATAAPMLLPYDTTFDDIDWWTSQGILIELMVAAMPEHVVQFNQLFTMNGVHRPYPRGYHGQHPCVKPKNGLSAAAQYVRTRVSDCLRDQIGLFRVGSWIKCQSCEKTCACQYSQDCKPVPECNSNFNASEPVNYADIIKCKPDFTPA
jgi:hypothetical protein